MRKGNAILSFLVLLALVLVACMPTGEQLPVDTPEFGEPGITIIPQTEELETETPQVEPTVGVAETTATPVVTVAPEATTPAAAETPTAGVEATPLLPGTGVLDQGRVTNLLDQQVWDTAEAEQVGAVADLVVNLQTTQVDYVILSINGEATTTRLVPVPWQAFRVSPVVDEPERAALALDVDPLELQGAPEVEQQDLDDLTAPAWEQEVRTYWGDLLPGGIQGAATPAAGATPAAATPAAGATPGTLTGRLGMEGLVSARSLLDTSILGPANQEIGSVNDLIVDLSTGQVAYLVLQAGEALGLGEQLILVPIQVLNRDPTSGEFQLPVEFEDLQNIPAFDPDSLPNTGLQDWDDQVRQFWNQFMNP